MTFLFDTELSREDLSARTGSLSQFAGVRLLTLGDGVERGVRLLEFRTGSGLRFTVAVDRGFDIFECEFRGVPIGWHSPAGLRHPGLHEGEAEGGLAFLRGFTGLLVTCGLDHALGPEEETAKHYGYPFRKRVGHTMHGRASYVPARLTGYGEEWRGETCVLWCEGVVSQATVFGENLALVRRIEADLGGNAIRLVDRVENRGYAPTPHMLLYHIDVGYPLLDEGARYIAPIRDVLWAAHAGEAYRRQGVGYRTMAGPRHPFVEQVWEHDMAADADGRVPVALVNDRLGLGFLVETRKSEFPCQLEWQNLQSGLYALGIEPVTNHVLGRAAARERRELTILEHGEARAYHSTFTVVSGAAALEEVEQRISSIARQPDEEFPTPSGVFPPLA